MLSRQKALTLLGLPTQATETEIKAAFKKAILKYHPDKNSHLDEAGRREMGYKFDEIKKAYDALSKPVPEIKKAYDALSKPVPKKTPTSSSSSTSYEFGNPSNTSYEWPSFKDFVSDILNTAKKFVVTAVNSYIDNISANSTLCHAIRNKNYRMIKAILSSPKLSGISDETLQVAIDSADKKLAKLIINHCGYFSESKIMMIAKHESQLPGILRDMINTRRVCPADYAAFKYPALNEKNMCYASMFALTFTMSMLIWAIHTEDSIGEDIALKALSIIMLATAAPILLDGYRRYNIFSACNNAYQSLDHEKTCDNNKAVVKMR